MMDPALLQKLSELMIFFPALMIAAIFHEYGHGWMAKRFGDPTAEEAGRLTLNPIPHVDLVGTIVFPLVCFLSGANFFFGWAKPVPIDPRRFSSFRKGLFFVSLAGPASNFIIAALSAIAAVAIHRFAPESLTLKEPIVLMMMTSVTINFSLGIFNLLPLPPLDGSKIVESFLPTRLAIQYESLARYGTVILLVLIISGALKFLSAPVRAATLTTLSFAERIIGL
jgi:Zn-dependent protease